MSLEVAFDKLCSDLQRLRGTLHDFNVNVEDKPESQSVRLVDDVSDEVTELFALSEESLSAAEEARRAAGAAFDPNQMRRSLATSQKHFYNLSRNLSSDLLSYERISELVRFGRGHRDWQGWVDSVRQGLETCRPGVEAVEDAYFQCWHEIAERVTTGPFSLHTTNIGQQITTAAVESAETTREGVT